MLYEQSLSEKPSDDFKRYAELGLEIKPTHSLFLHAYGYWLARSQDEIMAHNRLAVNYNYVEYYEKAYENASDENMLTTMSLILQDVHLVRNYYEGSIRQINHLIQFDLRPNLDLTEPRWEIYKITLSFPYKGFVKLL